MRPAIRRGRYYTRNSLVLGVLATVVIQPAEIAESRVLPLEAALPLLSGPVRRRVGAAFQSKRVRYLEDGRPVEGIRS